MKCEGQRSNQLNCVPTRQINEMPIASIYAVLHELHMLPNLLSTTQIACNRPKPLLNRRYEFQQIVITKLFSASR